MNQSFRRLLYRAKHYAIALVVLMLGGAVLSWVSSRMRQQELEQKLVLPPADIDTNDALTRQLSIFALGGMRFLAAEIATLDATDAWSKFDWPRCQRRWEAATTLAPQRENYWRRAAFDMISNAAGDMETKRGLTPIERTLAMEKYIKIGEEFLQKGLAANPNSIGLLLEQGMQYSNVYRKPKFRQSAEAYRRAVELGAPDTYEYMRFYSLCRARDAEMEAWQLGRRLIENTEYSSPSLRVLMFVLQNKIPVPAAEALSLDEIYRPYMLHHYGADCSDTKIVATAVNEMDCMVFNDLLYPIHGLKPAVVAGYLYLAGRYLERQSFKFIDAAEALERAKVLGAAPHELTLGSLLEKRSSYRIPLLSTAPELPRAFTVLPSPVTSPHAAE